MKQLPLLTETPGRPPARQRRPRPSPTAHLGDAVSVWADHLQREGMMPRTIKAFTADIQRLITHHGNVAVQAVTTRDLEQWLQVERKQSAPKSAMRRTTAVKGFFSWLTVCGALESDPAEAVIQHSVQSPLPNLLSEEDLARAMAEAEIIAHRTHKPDPRPKLLLTLLLETGLKKSEVVALEREQIHLDERALWVRYKEPRHRLKERRLNLSAAWIDLYWAFRATTEDFRTVFGLQARMLEYPLLAIAQPSGLVGRLTFDDCRWVYAVRLARAGTDLDLIRRNLGLSTSQWQEIGRKVRQLSQDEA